ncbi:glycoside hydrolase family 78 protein [Gracilibacillus alcaliphilus]|uniref:glycoside hydrolase family 78 protein n=1 Tax=Gracilibacillus alcaliphilus TaxID=1401441 RepID=UPI00195BFB23|nr:glycoside hydrolase family 78 protein [Gracilibacillus alcaliphilus]MBM7675618.1 alpha-L-rhamnosidase [Gracilibacillus alcaliphilus]
MVKVVNLRTEYQFNPIGIDVRIPRISWKLEAEQKGVLQQSYRIQVALSASFTDILFDSNEVVSDESHLVALDSLPVQSRTRYYFRVKVTDQLGRRSDWSDSAFFETGLLDASEWTAEWISSPKQAENESIPKFQHTFMLDGEVKQARIYATALGLYELQLNGGRVGQAYFTPGWTSYHKRLQYQTYDVTNQLRTGENKWTGLLGNGWYKGNLAWQGKKDIYGDRLALLAELHIELQNGETIVVKTDHDWQVTKSNIVTSEIYHGETIDARIEDNEWERAEVIDHPTSIIKAQENEPVRKIETLAPQALITTPNGEVVLDFGQNMVGWVSFEIEGEKGQTVELKHAEILDNDGNFYTANLRTAKQTNQYILSGNGKETFEPHFSFQGFRYVQLIGFKQGQLKPENFCGEVLHSDMTFTGDFRCSDPMINQLQHNIVWGLKGNFLDVPTDCPQRDERLGWTGDAQMFIRTASYLANVAPFFTKWLRDLEADQLEDGSVPFVVPNVLVDMNEPHENTDQHPYNSAAWGDAAVICPWTLYIAYGDKRILEEQYESMKAWIGYVKAQGDHPYLWNTGFHFGDWLALDAEPDSYIGATDRFYIATAFYAYSTSLVKKTAKVLGKEADYSYFADLENHIIEALHNEFVLSDGSLNISTQTGQVLALMFNLLEGESKNKAVQQLKQLLNETDCHLTTGFVGTPYLNHVLTENGWNEMAYKLLFQRDYPSWLYQITKGATTIWEHWDGIKEDGTFWSTDMNSFNHYAYGAIGDWLYRKVAGIELDEEVPGFKQFMIKPHIGDGLDWVEAKLESVYGTIRSAWKKTDDSISLEVTVPSNTTATVVLLKTKAEQVRENGRELTHAEGIQQVNEQEQQLEVSLVSGKYAFTYKMEN